MHRKLVLLPLLLLWAVATMAESKLTIIDLNGQEQQIAFAQLGKITFVDDVMYLYDEQGTLLGSTDLENVGRIIMNEEPTALGNVDGQLYIFPNPTQNALIVKGLPANQTLRVYDLQGKLMSATSTQTEDTLIDVSDLQNGAYLLQVGAQVVKFVKQ